MSTQSFFTRGDSGRVVPTPFALSLWGPDSLNGPAVCGLAAYAAESAHGREGWLPARFTLELFKAARRAPTSLHTEVLRDGHRIRVVQVSVRQDIGDRSGVLVAQGNTVFMKQADNPPGARWSPPAQDYDLPETDPSDHHTWFWDDVQGWGSDMSAYQNGRQRRLWSRPLPVLPDVESTPFQRAVISAEGTSLSTNWGEGGIGFINGDLTVALSRLPVGERMGVASDQHLENAGVSAGSAVLFDEQGPYGIGVVTALDNTRAMIDFQKVLPTSAFGGDGPFTPDGERRGDDRNV